MVSYMQFTTCILCDAPLIQSPSWQRLFSVQFSETVCLRCRNKFQVLNREVDEVYSLYEYNEAMRDYFHQYKFMRDVYLAHAFRNEIAATLAPFLKTAIIVPIPMHEENKKVRTFAQVDELLVAAHIPFRQCMQKITMETQGTKTRQERLAVKKLFDVIEDVRGKKLIIIDDIKTTGTTLALAKKALLEAGAQEVKAIALAAALR